MNRMKCSMKLLVCLLCMITLSIPISVYTKEVSDVVEIGTYEELEELATNCQLDQFSAGLEVQLTASIDVSGREFEGIPIFLGSFDGQGYTVSGIELTEENDYQGFFRYIGEDAKIRNLKVSGRIDSPSAYIGGIAGQNLGLIENCQFSGIINAKATIGGIVGENKGMIISAAVEGTLLGESSVGGIAGMNGGTIIRSENHAAIGTQLTPFSHTMSLEEVFTVQPLGIAADIVDLGGIAGVNTGVLQHVENEGDVGYAHVGYNIGGIVGRQSGYIAEATNNGHVQGRKEIGGIVGQIEPYVSTTYSVSQLQKLQNEMNRLSDLTTHLTEQSKGSNTAMSQQLRELNDTVHVSVKDTEVLLGEAQKLVDLNVEEVNAVSITLAEIVDDMVPITEDLDVTLEELEDTLKAIERAMNDLGDMIEGVEGIGDIGERVFEDLDQVNVHLISATNSFDSAVYALERAVELAQTGNSVESILVELARIPVAIQQAFDHMNASQYAFNQALQESKQLPGELQVITRAFDKSAEHVDEAFEEIDDMMDAVTDASDKMLQMIERLSEKQPAQFVSTNETYEAAKEQLVNSVGEINKTMDTVYTTSETQLMFLIDDFEAINQQINVVMNVFIEMIEEVLFADTTELFTVEDKSYEDIAELTAGKVMNCYNLGTIEGDINIGGIAGSIAFEYDFDKEDDYKADHTRRQVATKSGVAVIEACVNTGQVQGKKEGVGGIVGFMDFGYVTNCTSAATITSLEGDYVGGIAGRSLARIHKCYAKNDVRGRRFIGGIAGEGYVMQSNYVLGTVEALKGKSGAITGSIYDGEYQSVQDNLFVHTGIGGIDGVSYEGKATPIAYEALLAIGQMPDTFKQMTITFEADAQVVETKQIAYGKQWSQAVLPEIPHKQGCYGYWEVPEEGIITTDRTVRAIYRPYTTTIASAMKQEGLSKVLVDGAFTTEDEVLIVIEEAEQEGVLETFTVQMKDTSQPITQIRYLIPQASCRVQIWDDSEWQAVEGVKDGKYMVIPIEGDLEQPLRFQVYEGTLNTEPYKVISIIVLGGLCFLGIKRGLKKASMANNTTQISIEQDI